MKITHSIQRKTLLLTISTNDGMTFFDIKFTPFFITKESGNIIDINGMIDKAIPGFSLTFSILFISLFFRHNTKEAKAFFEGYGIDKDT